MNRITFKKKHAYTMKLNDLRNGQVVTINGGETPYIVGSHCLISLSIGEEVLKKDICRDNTYSLYKMDVNLELIS